MAHVIGDECVSCGSCEAECPVECISSGDDKYELSLREQIIMRSMLTLV